VLLVDFSTMASPQQPLVADGGLPSPVDDFMPTFYVGHHESNRPLPVTDFALRQAQDVGVCPPSRLENIC
jgi:protein arginine N-methyltransferase 5